MIVRKSDKELAFLQDLFVATDWGERFAELIDEHIELPEKGRLLYLGSGTGGHPMVLQERAGEKLALLCIDENRECLELARAKAIAAKEPAEFQQGKLTDLHLGENQFDCVVGDGSLVSPQRVLRMLSEMVKVARPGGTVVLTLPTASSFGEFFSVYWEALHICSLIDRESEVENLITGLPTVSEVEEKAEHEGLEKIASWTSIEEFDFESGEKFLNAPLISDFLMHGWLESVPAAERGRVSQEIARIINEERHEGEFALSVKATLVVGRKAHTH